MDTDVSRKAASRRVVLCDEDAEPARILLVDGDPASHERVAEVLRLEGLAVVGHDRADDALRSLADGVPDVIVLDLELPDLTGFEAVAAVRADARAAIVPVLILSARDDVRSRVAAFASGADCFLSKPWLSEELAATVRSLAGRGRLLGELESARGVLGAVAEVLDLLSLDAREHIVRSAAMARRFGCLLGLGRDDQWVLERAGYVHDVGKVGVPMAIVNKPGALTPAERAIMEQHPLYGERICGHLSGFERVLPIVRHHHEWWDGSGYPDGLAGERIPFLARVFQVVDVYDALVSRRVYKNALSRDRALAVLRDEAAAGKWDPGLVARFREFVHHGLFGGLLEPAHTTV